LPILKTDLNKHKCQGRAKPVGALKCYLCE